MTMQWLEGFDHYGGATPAAQRLTMLAGQWAQFNGNSGSGGNITVPELSQVEARTGDYSLFFRGGTTGTSVSETQLARRLWGASRTDPGLGFGLFMPSLPVVNNRQGVAFKSAANVAVLSFAFQSDGSIGVWAGLPTSGTLLGTSGQVLTAQAWNHIEISVTHSVGAGAVEIRVQAQTVLSLTGVNTGTQSSSCEFGQFINATNIQLIPFYLDDVFHRNSAGAFNNGFVGQVRILPVPLNGDVGGNDWTVTGAATGWQAVSEIPPDGDVSYIEGVAPGDISEFTTTPLDTNVTVLRAVYVPTLMRQSEAGLTNVQVSLISGGLEAPGIDRPITDVYTFWGDIFESDPATGAPWTRAGFNASLRRFEKTA